MTGKWALGNLFSIRLALMCTLLVQAATPAMAGGIPVGAAPNAAVMPLALGREWVYRDSAGETTIRVAGRELFAGLDCYRLDWVGVIPYQSEYWQVRGDGIYVVGRRVMDRLTRFATPYLLLRHAPVPGESWEAAVSSDSLMDTFRYSVGAEEEVVTPAGSFRALPVSVRGKTLEYRRWYAPGVGMVKETTALPDGSPLDEKLLVHDRE